MDRLDERRLLDVEEVEGAVEGDAAVVQQGAHGAVREDGALLETFEERVAQMGLLRVGTGSSIAWDIVLYCAACLGLNEGARPQ